MTTTTTAWYTELAKAQIDAFGIKTRYECQVKAQTMRPHLEQQVWQLNQAQWYELAGTADELCRVNRAAGAEACDLHAALAQLHYELRSQTARSMLLAIATASLLVIMWHLMENYC